MKKAFTLVELLIVIGIIGILSAVLIASFSGGTESARNAKCLTNMRNLAAACQTYGMASTYYPAAGSFEKFGVDESRGIRNAVHVFSEQKGWISWDSHGSYQSSPRSHVSSASWFTSCYNQDVATREYALTNGALWKYVSGNRNVYVCPKHKDSCAAARQPLWSYVMNSYFCWDKSQGSRAMDRDGSVGVRYGSMSRADRRLLFAELPFTDWVAEPSQDTDTSPGLKNDCTLQYEKKYGGEYIGFNHSSGKKMKFAHVVFADGHVEKITYPKTGMGLSQAQEITEWLCLGKDVSFDGKTYRKQTN